MSALAIFAYLGSICWISILLLPWKPWSTKQRISAEESMSDDLSSITVLMPARNEADTIQETFLGLTNQGKNLRAVLIDDQSTDGTSEKARAAATIDLNIITGTQLPEGWAGKLWALEQGRKHVVTDLILLLDADIQLKPGIISALLKKMQNEEYDLVSVMAHLRMKTFWEKLLIPSFIYFFKLLYPFALGNSKRSRLGVAAGGCVLLKRDALEKIGGFGALKGALIDDCTLAQKIKSSGGSTWIGLSHEVTSNRGYDTLGGIWNMVARSAYTQLKYSLLLLLGCTIMMVSMFLMAPIGLISEDTRRLASIGVLAMVITYLPTLIFYRRNQLFALLLPVAGLLYLAMTWSSAIRYWRGKRSEWKGRIYAKTVTKST